MSIAIVIPDHWDPSRLVYWSTMIALAKGEDLLIIRSKRLTSPCDRKKFRRNTQSTDSRLAAALQKHAANFMVVDKSLPRSKKASQGRKSRSATPRIFLKQLCHSELVTGVQKELRQSHVKLLIVPRQRGVRFNEEAFANERQLLLEAPCETIQLCPGKKPDDASGLVMVATSGSKSAKPALDLGAEFAAGKSEKLTALYVEDSGEFSPLTSRKKKVDRSLKKSLKAKAKHISQDTVVDADVPRGVSSYAKENGHELVILGAGREFVEDRKVPASVPERVLVETDEPTVVVVRKAMPLADRILKSVENRKKSLIPQLEREGRIELVERLEASTNWNFDFAFLMLLATMLASFGLALDSPVVVIGAMLVAPLMTPMVGVGLSVIQGNRRMAGKCIGTIARGLLVALVTGFTIGLVRICFTSGVTNEISIRGAPGVLDLVVAFVSGVVAAYAFGRPHLLSVLPGIAIATALVPPVAAAGLSLISLKLNIALGATLLFLSNFVAIVLGSASVLWLVGMRGPREISPFETWTTRWILGLFAGAVCLAVFCSVRPDPSVNAEPLAARKQHTERRAPTATELVNGKRNGDAVAPSLETSNANTVSDALLVIEDAPEKRTVLKPAITPDAQRANASVGPDQYIATPKEQQDVDVTPRQKTNNVRRRMPLRRAIAEIIKRSTETSRETAAQASQPPSRTKDAEEHR